MGSMIFIPIGVFIVAFLFIASVAFSTFKKSRKTVNKVIPIVEQQFSEQVSKTIVSEKSESKVCEYCGSTISNGVTECDSCGAKVKK